VEAAAALVESELPADPHELETRIRELLAARRGADSAFGEVAERVVAFRVWRALGYGSLPAYCRERLGMGYSTFKQRLWLSRRLGSLPPLRAALEEGRVSYTQALILARDGRPEDIETRIAAATATTWQQLSRQSTAEEEGQNRALGVRRIWAPTDAAETLALAIAAVQAARPGLDPGEALAVMADHFIAVWKELWKRRRVPKRRREVLARTGGLCARPGCGNPGDHVHHLTYRSRGGAAVAENEIGLCHRCHLRGVHEGRIVVRGEAGDLLTWDFHTGETWITKGDDDVERVL
jgi:hypothetical protein